MIRTLAVGLALLTLTSCATSGAQTLGAARTGIVFIEDDYPGALKAARERHKPLFVDTWAPWCHSCLFLKEHVFTDPALARNQSRFVFLSLNTERESSAPFLEKFPVENWPTLFVIDPATERAALKWAGTGTVAQLERLFADGEAAVGATGNPLLQGDQRFATGDVSGAIESYRAAVASGTGPHHDRAVESLLNALYARKDLEACVQTSLKEAPLLPHGPSYVNAVVWGLTCLSVAPPSLSGRATALAALSKLGHEALTFEGILADDRSGLYESLVDAAEEQKQPDEAHRLAEAWFSMLEAEQRAARTADARAAFDPHLVSAAIALKSPLRAEAALQRSALDFPADYNPPARLAALYREANRLDDALAAINLALTKVYGPRALRLYDTKAGILRKKGDRAGEAATLKAALAAASALPAAQRPEKTVAKLRAQLDAATQGAK